MVNSLNKSSTSSNRWYKNRKSKEPPVKTGGIEIVSKEPAVQTGGIKIRKTKDKPD